MKRFFNLLTVLMFLTASVSVFSQNADEDANKKAPVPFAGGEIVVKGKTLAAVEDASTTTVITDKDIKARGDKTLADALQGVPGVQTTTNGKGLTRMTLRGFAQDRVAVLIDGIVINADIYDGQNVDLSRINVMNISKVIVNRGASSALYGANGALGSINIITKKPQAMYTQANAEYGIYNNWTLNAAHGAPIGNAYYWLTASVQNSDSYAISSRLTTSKREKWLQRLTKYDLFGTTLAQMRTLTSVNNYLDDKGKWNHTEYTKYDIAGKIGYNITDKMEVGVSASYAGQDRKTNTFGVGMFNRINNAGTAWQTPGGLTDRPTSGGQVGANQAVANRAFCFDEYDAYISPYFMGEFGDFFIRANVFFYRNLSDADNYAFQDHSYMFFPAANAPNNVTARFENMFSSIWTNDSIGINILPSCKITDWNKVNFAVMYRKDTHIAEEKPIKGKAPDLITLRGESKYKIRKIIADYFTLAAEDEFKFNDLEFTVGISYDAQKFSKNKSLRGANDTTVGVFEDMPYMIKKDNMIWGTRDSFNPVASVVYTAMKDLLTLRSAFSSKTKFPTFQSYARVDSPSADLGLKPERSYNYNIGFETAPLGEMLNFRADYFYSRFNHKLERFLEDGVNAVRNIDGVISQGTELSISSKHKGIAGIVDITPSVSYTYIYTRQRLAKNDIHNLLKGNRPEDVPTHMFTFDIRSDFVTGTSLNIFGQYTHDQVRYVMKRDMTGASIPPNSYSTDYFTTVKLHNPFMLNVKLSQKLFENFDVYVLCKNILDDYNADPFNPGPGRMFYFGGSATF